MSALLKFDPKRDVLYIDEMKSLHHEEKGLYFLGRIYRILTTLFANRNYNLNTIIKTVETSPEAILALKNCITNISHQEKKERLQSLFDTRFPSSTIPKNTQDTNSPPNRPSTVIPSAPTTPSQKPLPPREKVTAEATPSENPNFLETAQKKDIEEYIQILRLSLPQTREDVQFALDMLKARFFKSKFLRETCYPIYVMKKWDDSFITKNPPLKIFLEEANPSQLKELLEGLLERKSQIESTIFSYNEALIKNKIPNPQE